MDLTIHPGKLHGTVAAIPSKSQAHRLLICAAFADAPTTLVCPDTNQDIEATVDCLNALGAEISRTSDGYEIIPIGQPPKSATLNCRESGSTLRFLLPIAGALGVDATFQMSGRLPQRPLSPLWEEMERMGCSLSRPTDRTILCQGKLRSGNYEISGSVSSQFITGLLYALSLLDGDSTLHVTGKIESRPYIEMTQQAMARFGVDTSDHRIKGGQRFRSPGMLQVEGDWSNGAFFLAAWHLGNEITVTNLDGASCQGDRAVVDFLSQLEQHCVIDAAQTPDLVPILAVVAAAKQGAVFTNAGRLRLKETDRLETTAALIRNLGGQAEIQGDELIVSGTGLTSGAVDAANDHRIAMAAGIAATVCSGPVTILQADSVRKSYPRFWEDYRRLGGHYEQHIR